MIQTINTIKAQIIQALDAGKTKRCLKDDK